MIENITVFINITNRQLRIDYCFYSLGKQSYAKFTESYGETRPKSDDI